MPVSVVNSLDNLFLTQMSDQELLRIQASEFIKITDNQTKILSILDQTLNQDYESADNTNGRYKLQKSIQ